MTSVHKACYRLFRLHSRESGRFRWCINGRYSTGWLPYYGCRPVNRVKIHASPVYRALLLRRSVHSLHCVIHRCYVSWYWNRWKGGWGRPAVHHSFRGGRDWDLMSAVWRIRWIDWSLLWKSVPVSDRYYKIRVTVADGHFRNNWWSSWRCRLWRRQILRIGLPYVHGNLLGSGEWWPYYFSGKGIGWGSTPSLRPMLHSSACLEGERKKRRLCK